MYKKERFDIFAPLEYLNGNSLCDYTLNKSSDIKQHLYKEEHHNVKADFKESFTNVYLGNMNKGILKRKSIIKQFAEGEPCRCNRSGPGENWEFKLPEQIVI